MSPWRCTNSPSLSVLPSFSPDHHCWTLLMASKTCSGVLSTKRVIVKSLFCFMLHRPPDTCLLFGAVFRDPAAVSLGQCAPERRGIKIAAVSWRSGLMPPGIIQTTGVDRVEAKIVDEAKHDGLGLRRV